MVASEQTSTNRGLQIEMYGEPLGDLVGRIGSALSITQARIAEVIGMSPAMLSQLCSGQRLKIGNPSVVERLRRVDKLARQVSAGQVTTSEVPARLDAIRVTTTGALSLPSAAPGEADPLATVRTLQSVLRAVASAEDLLAAAGLLDKRHPAVAEVLRVYGAGRTDAAREHLARIRPLL